MTSESVLDEKVFLRRMTPDDHPFVFNSFLKSYRDSPSVRGIPNTLFYAKHHLLIEQIFADPRLIAYVACNPDDHDQIYGYIVAQSYPMDDTAALAFHWVYCKQPFRNYGIARKLVEEVIATVAHIASNPIYYTHRVKSSDRLIRSYPNMVYNPYFLMGV